MYNIIVYETEAGNAPLKKFIETVNKKHDIRETTQINTFINRLEKYGLFINQNFPESIKLLRDGIWELRPGKNRILFFLNEDTIILLHGFRKVTNKCPPREIDNAISEKKHYLRSF